MTLNILRDIAKKKNSDIFSTMCDEATYIANTSQHVVLIRWVDENIIANNEFIELKDMPCTDTNSISIVFQLKDVLQRIHLNIRKYRDKCYDGCSTMSGLNKKGRCSAYQRRR